MTISTASNYVYFKPLSKKQKAIQKRAIQDLTPNKLYLLNERDNIVDDIGDTVCLAINVSLCAHLGDATRWLRATGRTVLAAEKGLNKLTVQDVEADLSLNKKRGKS